ncbi:9037_t:CDS:2, partial [Dentiscutata heterogama]
MSTNSFKEDVKNVSGLTIKTTVQVAASYVPIVDSVRTLFNEIYKLYENAECNKEMCIQMMERVEAAKYAIERMTRRNDNYCYEREYSLSLKRFVTVLTDIKEFTNKVSKLEGFRKFIEANKIKQQYDKLVHEYDACMKDLHFTVTIASENERSDDSKKIDKALKNLEKLNYGIEITNNKLDDIQSNITKSKSSGANAPRVKLDDPPTGNYSRGSVIKKYHRGAEVACKPIGDSSKHQSELAILVELGVSPNILKFYGLSNFDNHESMVFEWAEFEELKKLYDKFDIPWTRKVQMIRDICRGLVFLRELDILHHDIRCENIFVSQSLDPKLGNFVYARKANADTTKFLFQNKIEMFRWMAPEQIKKCQTNPKEKGYTFSCEMYSFGMLIWELCYEKIPYKRYINPMKISNHVLSGKREKLLVGKSDNPDDVIIQKKLIKLVDSGKITTSIKIHLSYLVKLHRKLEKLAKEYPIPFNRPLLLRDKELDLGACEEVDLDKGIEFHKKREYESAWKCFEENADFGDPVAKYWQGYYLFNGYFVEKDEEKANKFFKEVADNDEIYWHVDSDAQYQNAVSDASYRYAVSLLNDEKKREENRDEIIKYLELANKKKNPDAMYCLGNIYVNGKLKVEQNVDLGLQYLNSALKHNFSDREKVVDLLNKFSKN